MAIKMKKTHKKQRIINCTIVNHSPETSASANYSPENSGFPNYSPKNCSFPNYSLENWSFPNNTIVNHPMETSGSANYSPANSGFPNSVENSGFLNNLAEKSGYTDHHRRYECKTCGKKFDTFQALGGHQGIHRKIIPNEDLSLQIVVPKLHECKVCMKEFPTGQALGGHMRRHMVKKPPILMNKEVLWRKEAADEVVDSDLKLAAPEEPQWLKAAEEVVDSDLRLASAVEPRWRKAEEDQRHESKSELVLAAKELRLSI